MKYENQIKKIIEKKKDKLGIDKTIDNISMSKLGAGENNVNYIAKINNKKYVFRFPALRWKERYFPGEAMTLRNLPKGFGPELIYYDNSRSIINKPYIVLKYIEGKVITRWTDNHIKRHAKKLASLHKKKYKGFGYPGRLKEKIDIKKYISDELDGFKERKIEIDKELEKITSNIKKYAKKNEKLFLDLKKSSFIHGDLCMSNIVFTKDDVKYIDWEWGRLGDPAGDVAMVFDDYAQPPWKMKLTGKRKDLYLNTYLRYDPDKTLKERVEVWKNVYKLIDAYFFRWRLKSFDEHKEAHPKSFYKKNLKLVMDNLRKEFL